MFSGIVELLGEVETGVDGDGRLRLRAGAGLADVRVGDSVAVNGCCLTVVAHDGATLVADVMPETARRTTIGRLGAGDAVNLEGALRHGDRVGGHLVSGHVDGVGSVLARRDEQNAVWVTVEAPDEVARHLVPRGCVAVDGISLTVVDVAGASFRVSLIPHTVAATTARGWQPGVAVNLESDLTAKYVERAVAARLPSAAAAGVGAAGPEAGG